MRADRWPRSQFTLPRLIVCEGRADEAFIRSLIRARSLSEVSVRNPEDRAKASSGGITQIGSLMAGFPATEGFSALKSILILVDSDLDPIRNFQLVCDQLRAIDDQPFDVPSAPSKASTGSPAVTIALLPGSDKSGNLETLCLEAALSVSASVSSCVEGFAHCVEVTTWECTKLGKMKLRSLLAARHKRDPFIGLGRIWNEAPELIPLDHPCFDEIAELFRTF